VNSLTHIDSDLNRRRNKLGFTQAQLRPGFGKSVDHREMRRLGYKRIKAWGWGNEVFKAKDRFEAWQRLEYERVMGRMPVLGRETATIEDCLVDAS
jgi:hypothetical protein